MADINLIEKLSNVSGISGNEEEVLDILKNVINGYVDSCEIDALNNLIALKNFSSKEPKVMLNAHMDEVVVC